MVCDRIGVTGSRAKRLSVLHIEEADSRGGVRRLGMTGDFTLYLKTSVFARPQAVAIRLSRGRGEPRPHGVS